MNRVFPKPRLTSYEADFAQWSLEQAELLRDGSIEGLDRENLAEEIESLGRSDKREIGNRLGKLLVHLLKWRFQPEGRSGSWRSSIREQRRGVAKLIEESPSLKGHPAEVLAEEYEAARIDASDETGLNLSVFPLECPFSLQQILDPEFLPDEIPSR